MGFIISIAAIVIMIVIAIQIVRRILFMGRDMRNQFRNAMGKDSAELDKANKILSENTKNGLIPKCAIEDAAKTLAKYYDQSAAWEYVVTYLQGYEIKQIEFPRAFYFDMCKSKEELSSICKSYFAKFNFKEMEKDGAMTERDFTTFNNLAYMWYFADSSVQSLEDAHNAVRNVFGEFCEENPDKIIQK